MCIGWQAPSLGQVVLLVLLATTQVYKHGDYKPRCPFHGAPHGAQYLSDLLHKYRVVAIRINHPKKFNSELTSTNKSQSHIVASFI